MNKIRLIALLCVLLPGPAIAQTFTKLAPLPAGTDLWGVWFTSPDNGWIAGAAHTLYKTTDGGLTWTFVPMPGYADQPFYDVTFVDSQRGFVAGNSAVGSQDIYETADGGQTWQQAPNFPLGGSWYHIKFVSPTTGFMGSNGALVRTTDGGASWPVRSAYPDCPIIYGMDFLDANTGLVGGYQVSSGQQGMFKTTDGGRTWQLKHAGGGNDAIYLTGSIALADDGTSILRSSNGGETWSAVGTVATGLIDLEKVDSNTVVGVSARGDVWRSGDGGFTWGRRWIGEGDLPATWKIRFSDPSNGHVVGQGGGVFETADGGLTWTRVNRGIGRDWNGIAAFSDSRVVLAGLHGYVQSTGDAGAHWTPALLDPPTFGRDTAFSDISVADATTAVVAGHWGSLFKTTDQGATWTNLSSSLNPSYYANGVKFTDANNGWIVGFDYNVGSKSYIRRTSDGGATWTTASLNVPSLAVDFIGQAGYVLTTSQPLYRTTDGGATWTALSLATPSGSATSNTQMSWASANVGYVAGFDGFLAKTTDGGASWSPVRPAQESFVYLDVKAAGGSEVWACGAIQGGGNAIVIRSLDGGATWTTWSLPGQFTAPSRIAAATSYVYVTGYAGETWRFDRGGPDFVVTASPSSQSVVQGSGTTYTVNVSGLGGFANPVSLAVSGQPAGATATLSPTFVNPGQSATLTVTTSGTTLPGAYTLTITGTSGALLRTATVTLVVKAPPTPDFSISASPSGQIISRGGDATYTVTITSLNGFAGTVNLSVTGAPFGATATFTPASVSGTGTSTLKVATRSNTARGTYTLRITGTSGTLLHSTTVTLTIRR